MEVEDKHCYGSAKEGRLWERLTIQEREELLLALEESEDPKNLISHDEMKKKHLLPDSF